MLLTNELPRLSDASGALASRFLMLCMTQSFYGKEDHDLTEKLLGELPGILLWAIEGWRRLRGRGRFQQPEAGSEMLDDLADLTSPVGMFVRERCKVSTTGEVAIDVLFDAWREWCESTGRREAGTKQTFGRDLASVVPGLHRERPREGGERQRIYKGIELAH
jgi:putative DNA primase/helicase